MSTRAKSTQKLRLEIAENAAKLIAVGGVANYHAAKKKAALQLGAGSNAGLPTNQEVEQALVNYQSLFQSNRQMLQLKSLRLQAIRAMKLLSPFRPFLVGPVATGTATRFSEITLHLYFDQVEQIGLFLHDRGIPNTMCEKHIRINAKQSIVCPAYSFIADHMVIVIVIFSEKDRNLTPLSSIDNRAMKMLSVERVIRLVEESRDSAAS